MTEQEINKEIGSEILVQLGGYHRLNAMVGLKDVMIIARGISFKIKVPGVKANYVKIQLNSSDTYDVELGKLRGFNYKVVDRTEVYAVMLKDLISRGCGVALSL